MTGFGELSVTRFSAQRKRQAYGLLSPPPAAMKLINEANILGAAVISVVQSSASSLASFQQ